MSDSYPRNCIKCERPILMTETMNGWQPFEQDGSGRHYCNNPVVATVYTSAPFNDFSERVTRPTKCWWCDELVFFHSNGNGDAVLLDELSGAPWPVHSCWEKYKADKQHINKKITEDSRIHKPRPELRSIGPCRLEHAANELITLSGCVVKSWKAKPSDSNLLPDDHEKLIVSTGESQGYIVVTSHIFNLIPDESLVDIDLFFLKAPEGFNIPVAKKIRYESQGKVRVKRMLKRHNPGECDYCGEGYQKRIILNDHWHLECQACHKLRGGLPASTFLPMVKKIANHFYKGDVRPQREKKKPVDSSK